MRGCGLRSRWGIGTSRWRWWGSVCWCRMMRRWSSCWGGWGWRSSGRGRCSCRWARGIGMTEAWLAVLQFADGLFPAGGFAHSFGLETYAQEGGVRDRAGLEAFIAAHLEGSAGPCDAVAAAVAVRLADAA